MPVHSLNIVLGHKASYKQWGATQSKAVYRKVLLCNIFEILVEV